MICFLLLAENLKHSLFLCDALLDVCILGSDFRFSLFLLPFTLSLLVASLSIFIFRICFKFSSPKKKTLVTTCVFECFQSHCHNLKELYEFFKKGMMSAIIIFEESSFIFSFVSSGLMKKSLEAGVHI